MKSNSKEKLSGKAQKKNDANEGVKSKFKMVEIPEKNILVSETTVTQDLYEEVMLENPSGSTGNKLPITNVCRYDALNFCNRLSEMEGLEPVYSVNGKTDVDDWDWINQYVDDYEDEYDEEDEDEDEDLDEEEEEDEDEGFGIDINEDANGYRLPSVEEWYYCARGGEDYKYAGSDDLAEVGWYGEKGVHEVAQKKPNGYGLYDMSGNVWECCKEDVPPYYENNVICGGSYEDSTEECNIRGDDKLIPAYNRSYHPAQYECNIGFRIVRNKS